MKGQYSLTLAFNAIFFTIFILLLSHSMHVEGLRLLKDHSSSSSTMEAAGLFISQDYSGPSRRGSGHWWEPCIVSFFTCSKEKASWSTYSILLFQICLNQYIYIYPNTCSVKVVKKFYGDRSYVRACQPRTKSDCTLNIVRICTAFVNVKCKWASLLSGIYMIQFLYFMIYILFCCI